MKDAKSVCIPLCVQFKLSKVKSPKTIEEYAYMESVPYALAIGNLMYAMICTKLDISHTVGAVSSD